MIVHIKAAALAGLGFLAASDAGAEPSRDELALIVEARELLHRYGDTLWPGLSAAPDTLLLIQGEAEYLLCHEGPAEGFAAIGNEPQTGCDLRRRDRVLPPQLLASFPLVDGEPTVVVGTPEATGFDPDSWMLTLLHEHVHQWHFAEPGLNEATTALDLDGGDQTGQWMLDFPFPYEEEAVASAAGEMAARALAIIGSDGDVAPDAFEGFLAARATFLAAAGERNARYYQFQVWREGVARWTEMALARAAATDDARYAQLAAGQLERMRRGLTDFDLVRDRRVSFYALGSAEAEILERAWPSWRAAYLDRPYDMTALFDRAAAGQR